MIIDKNIKDLKMSMDRKRFKHFLKVFKSMVANPDKGKIDIKPNF